MKSSLTTQKTCKNINTHFTLDTPFTMPEAVFFYFNKTSMDLFVCFLKKISLLAFNHQMQCLKHICHDRVHDFNGVHFHYNLFCWYWRERLGTVCEISGKDVYVLFCNNIWFFIYLTPVGYESTRIGDLLLFIQKIRYARLRLSQFSQTRMTVRSKVGGVPRQMRHSTRRRSCTWPITNSVWRVNSVLEGWGAMTKRMTHASWSTSRSQLMPNSIFVPLLHSLTANRVK